MANKYTKEEMKKLLNGYYVDPKFYQKVTAAIDQNVGYIEPEKLYTCRDLCGESFWTVLSKPEKWYAGRCLAYAVSSKQYDLKAVKYKRSPTKRYRLN